MAKKTKEITPATVKVKILAPVAGVFQLSHDVGKVYDIETKQAEEIVEAGYGEYVK